MAVNVVIEGNLLKVNVGGTKVHYWNASWVSIHFDATAVYLQYNSSQDSNDAWNVNPYKILFTDFEYDEVAYITEVAIATILSDKIG